MKSYEYAVDIRGPGGDFLAAEHFLPNSAVYQKQPKMCPIDPYCSFLVPHHMPVSSSFQPYRNILGKVIQGVPSKLS